MTSAGEQVGRVVAIRRYPIKSMRGEDLDATDVSAGGVVGDRACALVDAETGRVASAKNPRRWPNLFEFGAGYVERPRVGAALPAVRVSFPDGSEATTVDLDIEARLSVAVGRPVRLTRSAPAGARAEGYWPDHAWLAERDRVFEFQFPPGTLFDGDRIHVLTTATLDGLRRAEPGSRFDAARFRPNFVVETGPAAPPFVENAWAGRTLQVGEARLRIERPCPRCVMTTLAQGDLEADPTVLRTAVERNGGNVGVYAAVERAGTVRRGDPARLL